MSCASAARRCAFAARAFVSPPRDACACRCARRAVTLTRLNEMSLGAGERDNKVLEQSLSEAGFI